jgi:4-hydroxy-tetrahydrodipicolinate synthase
MPKKYRKSEAKEWARQTWHGLCNVIIPSFSADLKTLNEKAIRYDVRRNIELGFWGALLVSEAATTDEEYLHFTEIAIDEAKGKHNFLFHGCFDTVEDIVRMANAADALGVDGHLLGHPPSFYPQSNRNSTTTRNSSATRPRSARSASRSRTGTSIACTQAAIRRT